MTQQPNIQLVDNFFLLDPGQTMPGGLKIQVDNDTGATMALSKIIVKIPLGAAPDGLAAGNDFGLHTEPDWTKPPAPYDIDGRHVTISLTNEKNHLLAGQSDQFSFYHIPFVPNPEGTAERTVTILVACYATEADTAPYVAELAFSLKNQAEDKVPFVNYFALEATEDQNKKVTLVWNISHGGNMMIYPRLLTNQERPLIQPRSTETLSDQDPQPIRIRDETPITLSQSAGTLELELVQSTQFTLVPDGGGGENYQGQQISVYIRELAVVYLQGRGFEPNAPSPALTRYLEPVTLDWLATYTNKADTENEAWLIITEYKRHYEDRIKESDLSNVLLPDQNSPKPPVRVYTRAVKVWPLSEEEQIPGLQARMQANILHGSFTYYPVRRTDFQLYLSERNTNPTSEIFQIMTTSGSNPIGSIIMFMGDVVPEGWQLCAGGSIEKTEIPETFDELARVLRQTGNSGTVTLPDLRDRFPVATGKYKIGDRGGPDPVEHYHLYDLNQQKTVFMTEGIEGVNSKEYPANIQVPTSGGSNYQWVATPWHAHHYDAAAEGTGVDRYDHKHKKKNKERTALALQNRPMYYALHFIIRVA